MPLVPIPHPPAQNLASQGVKRIEAINSAITPVLRVALYVSLFFVAYTYGLDGQTRYTYQSYATASYAQHSLLGTINTVRGVIGAAAQPTIAKLLDTFGRTEILAFSVFFYTLGTIVEAVSHGVEAFSAGAVLYQIGYTAILLIAEIIVGDTSSLRNRVLLSFVPATPFLINAWISGDVTQAVLDATTWRWGVGMWAIIYTVLSLPLLATLWYAGHKAKREGKLDDYVSPFKKLGFKGLVTRLFWDLDVIGIILVIAVFSLILVPFSIATSAGEKWRQGYIIAMLVLGVFLIPVFVIWEKFAPTPLVPFHLLKDRGVWAGLGIACFINATWYLQGSYLYTTLVVAFDQSIKSATRITNIYSFTSVITGVILGFVVRYVRYLKIFIITGICLFMVAFGLLIRYRSGGSGGNNSAIIGAEIVLGVGGGLFSYPTQASVQAATTHKNMAIVTGLYLACYSIGSAIGSTVSAAIWTNILPGELNKHLTNQTFAAEVYGNPLGIAPLYPLGTPERDGIIEAYKSVQRLLCITGLCLCIPMLFFALLLRNPRLGDEQSLPEAEGGAEAVVLPPTYSKKDEEGSLEDGDVKDKAHYEGSAH
ncbi:MFS general substrate transporter, partial [Atractiella rhizophila]